MQPMNRFKTSPVQHINRPAAQGGGGDPLLGALGGVIGGVLGAPLGPLGVAMGSSIGGSLAGKGDLSGVTPEGVALGTLTAGIPMPGAADAAKVATEGAKATATQAASQAATDAALAGATEAATTGATEGLKGALSQQGATNLAGMAAPTIGEATTSPTLLGSVRNLFSPDGLTNMAKESAGGWVKNPNTIAEIGVNKVIGGLGKVKDSLFGAKAATLADGGPVETAGPGGTGGVGYNNPQEDYSDSVKRSKLLKGVLAGGGLMGLLDLMGDDRMNLAKGGYAGKGCGCGPMANCNC